MAHIVEFSIEGLAGRKAVFAKKLNRDVNIFFGNNGSGKTSLLKILHSAFEESPVTLAHVPFKEAEVKIFSAHYNKTFTRTISQPSDTATKIAPSAPELSTREGLTAAVTAERPVNWHTVPSQPEFQGLSHRYLPISRLFAGAARGAQTERYAIANYVNYLRHADTSNTEEELDRQVAKSLQQLWAAYSATISQKVREAQQKGLASILREVLSESAKRGGRASAPDASLAFRRVAAFLARQPGFSNVLGAEEDFAARYNSDPNLQNIVSDIEEVEKNIEQASAPRERLKELIGSMFNKNKDVIFSETDIEVRVDKKMKIELPFLSSGEKQLLFILVETLAADISTILVDEPELSMHVDWQKHLVRGMQTLNPQAQCILATHSPEIMADVPDDKIFRL